ncbi:MAG: hypothetical protein MSS95_02280 [Bacteroidales bacterium]|nr:hypothetical protein [Bacteroidales bacterium]MDY3216993.1 hypothetical protein [Sodaliphilus sp.]
MKIEQILRSAVLAGICIGIAGFGYLADKEAERVDEEIFFYTSESDLKLPDNELVAILSESNPDWFD